MRGLWGSGAGGSQDICVCSPRHGARGEHAMASEEHKMAFAEHARKGGAGSRVFPRSTETYRPRRKNIMNSIFRQNVFAKNNVLQITYISPRLPQRFVLFCFFFVSPQRVYPFWNSNSKQIPFWEFKFHCRNMSRVSGTRVTVNAIKCHFLEHRATRVGSEIFLPRFFNFPAAVCRRGTAEHRRTRSRPQVTSNEVLYVDRHVHRHADVSRREAIFNI